jgi:hypothetical protein
VIPLDFEEYNCKRQVTRVPPSDGCLHHNTSWAPHIVCVTLTYLCSTCKCYWIQECDSKLVPFGNMHKLPWTMDDIHKTDTEAVRAWVSRNVLHATRHLEAMLHECQPADR